VSVKAGRLGFLYLGKKGKALAAECIGGLAKSVDKCAEPCS